MRRALVQGMRISPVSRGIGVISVLSAAALILFYVLRYPISTAFFFSVATCATIAALTFLFHSCLVSHRMTCRGDASARMLVGIMLVACLLSLVAECLTLVGAPVSTPLNLADWSKKRLAAFFFMFVLIQMLYLFRSPATYKAGTVLASMRAGSTLRVLLSGSSMVLTLITLFMFVGMSLASSFAVGSVAGEAAGRLIFFTSITLAGIAVLVLMAVGVMRKPEAVFLSLCILSGSFLVFALPSVTAISWDDEIHYDRALGLSYLGHSEYSEADVMLVHKPWAAVDLDLELVDEYTEVVADTADAAERTDAYREAIGLFTPVGGASLAEVSTIGYIPSAVALWLARLLQLPLSLSLIAGRLGNLLSYAIVVAFAIRIAPVKKGIMATIGLLPTSVYLASNYSYDPVVVSFIMLAIALILREVHNPEKRLTPSTMLAIVSALFVGLAPKAIYFPIIGLLFLMPKSKFENADRYRSYVFSVVVFGLIMVCSFILPMLFSASAQAGDLRGGSDVSASGQIMYILSHPIEYLCTLGAFMLDYLSPTNSDMYSVSYAYMGFLPSVLPWTSAVSFACLVAVAFFDAGSEPKRVVGTIGKCCAFFIFIATVALVCTALYVSFTPVGLETINGCQARYLIPLLACASLAVPSVNAGQNQGQDSETCGSDAICSVSMKMGPAFMYIMLILCSFNFVVFW